MYTLVEIALTVGVLVTLVSAISACVCGCKNSNQKSELVGTAGVVKIRFDEEAPSPTPTTPASIKRASTQNSHRSLPEIPHQVGRQDSGDTTSEIYATVNLEEGVAVQSTSRHHPYEHAYAQLQKENHASVEVVVDSEPDDNIQQREVAQDGPESVVISASVAISGQLPSSQELPYITPPAVEQAHFSGDSTDSAKGYTSISVREPLSNIRAQSTKPPPHYATVSDDSDEMYAAIDDPSAADTYAQIHSHEDTHSGRRKTTPEMGASTSTATHSHSRQASSSSLSPSALGSPKPEKRQANSPLPPPPLHRPPSAGDVPVNYDKLRRSLNEKHERNNSCVSSSDFYGCNYPVEKHRFSYGDLTRAKESDRPDINVYNSITPSDRSDQSPDRSTDSPSRNVEEMYAKVNKKTRKEEAKRRSKELTEPAKSDDPGYETIDRKKSAGHGYETIVPKVAQDPGYETVVTKVRQDPGYETVASKARQDPGYETVVTKVRQDPGYETVTTKSRQDPGYETVANKAARQDPGYETVVTKARQDPGYETVGEQTARSDPGYEVLRNTTPPYATIAPTYSTVSKKDKYWAHNNNDEIVEPKYESMPHEPPYAPGSESDPNYESVRPKRDRDDDTASSQDPDYESLRLKDPNYESVRSRRSKDPNYESVKYSEVSRKEPPYEKVVSEGAAAVQRSDSTTYERIDLTRTNGSHDVVDDYFQV